MDKVKMLKGRFFFFSSLKEKVHKWPGSVLNAVKLEIM